MLFIIGAKLLWEKLAGASTLVQDLIGLPVATDTHLYGFVGGLVLGAIMAVSIHRD